MNAMATDASAVSEMLDRPAAGAWARSPRGMAGLEAALAEMCGNGEG